MERGDFENSYWKKDTSYLVFSDFDDKILKFRHNDKTVREMPWPKERQVASGEFLVGLRYGFCVVKDAETNIYNSVLIIDKEKNDIVADIKLPNTGVPPTFVEGFYAPEVDAAAYFDDNLKWAIIIDYKAIVASLVNVPKP